jgi:hypothetical protein
MKDDSIGHDGRLYAEKVCAINLFSEGTEPIFGGGEENSRYWSK